MATLVGKKIEIKLSWYQKLWKEGNFEKNIVVGELKIKEENWRFTLKRNKQTNKQTKKNATRVR